MGTSQSTKSKTIANINNKAYVLNSKQHKKYIFQSQFELTSKNSRMGMMNLSDRETEELYICRRISLIDTTAISQMERLIDLKLSLYSPFIMKLEKVKT